MIVSILAQRYAKALFELAHEMDILDEVNEDMKLVRNTCKDSKEFRLFLESPVIKTDKKQHILKALFEGKIQELSFRFIMLITRKDRESHLESISIAFIELYKKFKNILTVKLETAVDIDEALKQKVVDLLTEQTGSHIDLEMHVDKDLIGGFILNYSEKQYDASIRYQLNRLRRNAASINLYERKL
jgi:F-type H+-transporting ATPase subunit delta